MQRYAALLRGVMPYNAKMPELAAAFSTAGFREVRTVLASGNVLFSAPAAQETTLERRAEAAMAERLGRAFPTIVRPVSRLREILASDPWTGCELPRDAKRVVTFLRQAPPQPIALPVEEEGARILALVGREAFTFYVRLAKTKGPGFMGLIERTFGKEVTTRTWDTVARLAR